MSEYRDLEELLPPATAPYAVALLQQLAAPPSLHYLSGVVAGLDQLLPLLKQIAMLSDEECSDELTVGTEAILELIKVSAPACPSQWSTPSARRTDPMHGVIAQCQVYVLPAYAPFGEPPAQFLQLLAQALHAALRLQGARRSGTRGPGTTIDRGTAGARLLARQPHLVQTLPATAMSAQAYRQALGDALQEASGLGINHMEQVLALLQLAQGNDLPPNVGYSSEMFDRDGSARVAIRQYITYSSARIREARRSGLALAELADEQEFCSFGRASGEASPTEDVTVAQLVLKRRHQLVQLERAAQMLSIGWHRFTLSDAAQVIRVFRRLAFGGEDGADGGDSPSAVDVGAGAVLATVFWMSRSQEDALALQIYRSRADLPQTVQLRRLAFILDSNQWCVPAIRPRGAPRFQDVDRTAAYPASTVVLLPAPSSAVKVLRRLPASDHAQRQGSAFAFAGDIGPVRERVNDTLTELRAHSRGQITAGCIGDHLFLSVVDLTRDVALASMMFERPHALGDTQLHYASFDMSMLASVYGQITRHIQDATFAETQRTFPLTAEHPDAWPGSGPPAPPGAATPPPPPAPSRVGSPICPSPNSVHDLAITIRKAVANATNSENSFAVIMEVHNRLNVYVSLMLKFTLGLRDVIGPTPAWNQVDLEDATIIVSDKDDAASFSTRLLPLPDLVVLQLRRLREHLEAMIPSLSLRAPFIATQITAALRGGPPAPLPLTFLLTERSGKLDLQAASGSPMNRLVADHAPSFALPGNANRHFLRGILVDRGCPTLAVDYLLGHWRRGGEPLGRFATLDLEHYLSVLRDHLQAIAHDAGWRVLSGLR